MKPAAKAGLRWPAGRARELVRGFSASNFESTRRLKVIAALLAPTMATPSQVTSRQVGHPRRASKAPVKAKGNAKTECSNRIISRVVLTLATNPRGWAGDSAALMVALDAARGSSPDRGAVVLRDSLVIRKHYLARRVAGESIRGCLGPGAAQPGQSGGEGRAHGTVEFAGGWFRFLNVAVRTP